MTPFGANDYGISQTKRFTTLILIPLDVLPRNKKKMGEIHESAVFFNASLPPFLGWVWT